MSDAEAYRRKAQLFLDLARHVTNSEDRAAMIRMAAFWKERADEIEQNERQQQQQTQPKKESEGERS